MATIKNFPNNADEYIGAEYVMKWLHGRTSGVFGADENLAVSANDDMTVSVSDGVGWIANADADGSVFWNDNEDTYGSKLTLSIGLANSSLPRIDRVVVSWATVDYSAKPTIEILQGSPASNPTAPALTNTTLKRQISLAQIRVGAGASRITASDITDERLNSAVCGLVTSGVGVDTSVMQSQFNELLEHIKDELDRLNYGTETMLKSVYDTQGKNEDVFLYADSKSDEISNKLTSVSNRVTSLESHSPAFTLLWTNSNPGSSFTAKTVILSLSEYKMVLINGIWNASNGQITSSIFVDVGKKARLAACIQLMAYRDVTVSTTGVTFGSGMVFSEYNQGASQDNSKCIPYEIYGIKF